MLLLVFVWMLLFYKLSVGYIFFVYLFNSTEIEDGHIVTGRLKWNGEKHFHLRVSVTPESDEPEAYKIVILLDTPIQAFKTASVHARYSMHVHIVVTDCVQSAIKHRNYVKFMSESCRL